VRAGAPQKTGRQRCSQSVGAHGKTSHLRQRGGVEERPRQTRCRGGAAAARPPQGQTRMWRGSQGAAKRGGVWRVGRPHDACGARGRGVNRLHGRRLTPTRRRCNSADGCVARDTQTASGPQQPL